MSAINNPNKLKEGQSMGLFIFECVMSIVYLAFAYIFFFTNMFGDSIHGVVRMALGTLLGFYGIFRVFRAIRRIVKKNE